MMREDDSQDNREPVRITIRLSAADYEMAAELARDAGDPGVEAHLERMIAGHLAHLRVGLDDDIPF